MGINISKNNIFGAHLIISSNESDVDVYFKKVISLIDEDRNDLELDDIQRYSNIIHITPKNNKNTVSINQIRELITFIEQKPLSKHYKAIYIPQAYKMSIQAQNALLKTLEEPPSYAILILGVKTKRDILETILSRCRLIDLRNTNKYITDSKNKSGILKQIYKSPIDWAETISKLEIDEIDDVLFDLINELRLEFLTDNQDNNKVLNAIESVLETKKDINSTNINKRLAIEKSALLIAFLNQSA